MGKGKFEIKLARVVVSIQPRYKTVKKTDTSIHYVYIFSSYLTENTVCFHYKDID